MKFENYTQELAEIWRKFRISPHSDSRPCVTGNGSPSMNIAITGALSTLRIQHEYTQSYNLMERGHQ